MDSTFSHVAKRHSSRVGTSREAQDVSRMEDLIDESTIESFLKGNGKNMMESEHAEMFMAGTSVPSTNISSSRVGGSRFGSTIAQEIQDMERESNFMQIREEARELKTVLDVTRYARSYLPGKLVNTDMSIAFISEELMLPLMPNENFLETWGDARLTYIERRKIMEKIHLMEDD